MTEPQRFSVGVNYLAPAPGSRWCAAAEAAIAHDLTHIAALGLDAVRLPIRWDELQPQPDAADAAVLDRVRWIVERAAAANLRVLPTLCGRVGERDVVPAWASAMRDLFSGPLLDAQRVLARALAERLRGAPNIVAYDIGHAFTRVRAPRAGTVSTGEHASAPASEPDVAAWARTLAREVREGGIATTAGTYDGDLIDDTGIRLGSLCAPFAFASMQGSTLRAPFARGRLDPEVVPFLAALAAAFSFKPVLVTAVGNPTCPAGRFSPYDRFTRPGEPDPWTVAPGDPVFAPYPCYSEDENAAYATAVLERLHADGRLGAYWWCWSDGPDDAAPHEQTYGIVRRDGTEKAVAAALAAFARTAPPVRRPNDPPTIAATYYYRTLPESTRTLYDAHLARRITSAST